MRVVDAAYRTDDRKRDPRRPGESRPRRPRSRTIAAGETAHRFGYALLSLAARFVIFRRGHEGAERLVPYSSIYLVHRFPRDKKLSKKYGLLISSKSASPISATAVRHENIAQKNPGKAPPCALRRASVT
nr:hypothetical protein [Burkholderia multivorans]